MSDQPKNAHELTTDEAMQRLFHPDAIDHLKRTAQEADERGENRAKGASRRRSVIKNERS